jgi:hypothetical protein
MSTMRWDRLTRLTLMLAIPFWAAACSKSEKISTVPAKGTVIYKGKPLEKGQIQLIPDNGPAAVGLIENGNFVVGTNADGDGAPPGKYRVTVASYKENKNRFGETVTKAVLPARFASPDTSGIVVEISESGNEAIKVDLAD